MGTTCSVDVIDGRGIIAADRHNHHNDVAPIPHTSGAASRPFHSAGPPSQRRQRLLGVPDDIVCPIGAFSTNTCLPSQQQQQHISPRALNPSHKLEAHDHHSTGNTSPSTMAVLEALQSVAPPRLPSAESSSVSLPPHVPPTDGIDCFGEDDAEDDPHADDDDDSMDGFYNGNDTAPAHTKGIHSRDIVSMHRPHDDKDLHHYHPQNVSTINVATGRGTARQDSIFGRRGSNNSSASETRIGAAADVSSSGHHLLMLPFPDDKGGSSAGSVSPYRSILSCPGTPRSVAASTSGVAEEPTSAVHPHPPQRVSFFSHAVVLGYHDGDEHDPPALASFGEVSMGPPTLPTFPSPPGHPHTHQQGGHTTSANCTPHVSVTSLRGVTLTRSFSVDNQIDSLCDEFGVASGAGNTLVPILCPLTPQRRQLARRASRSSAAMHQGSGSYNASLRSHNSNVSANNFALPQLQQYQGQQHRQQHRGGRRLPHGGDSTYPAQVNFNQVAKQNESASSHQLSDGFSHMPSL